MTREQLQQVRDTLLWLLSKVPIEVQGAAAQYESAKTILDAELALPEAREKIGNFDICKAMAVEGKDIRVSPLSNITNLQKVKPEPT